MNVYFIQCGKRGAVKIGKSNNVDKRLEALQSANPKKLHIRIVFPCSSELHAMETEKKLHRRFKHHRIRGEWFKPHILKVISESDLESEDHKLRDWLVDYQAEIDSHFSAL